MTTTAKRHKTDPHGKATPHWRRAVKLAARDPAVLCRALGLPTELAERASPAAGAFSLFAPWEFIARMQPGDPHDPLLLQVLPVAEESEPAAGFSADPVGDGAAELSPGLLHKYQGRALLIATGVCAVHCRYCFRRHFPYGQSPKSLAAWAPALAQLAEDDSISEAILSGGDPLMLGDEQLAELVARLAEIPHLRRLRIHSRLPIVIPQRVTDGLLAALRSTRLTAYMVVHANHANELDEATLAALGRLVDAGIPTLNQAVLLRGVNDNPQSQEALCRRLVDHRVTPYYLHQLDRVAGAAHFDVARETGLAIVEHLRRTLPGYAVPKYVAEAAGMAYKSPIIAER